MRVLQLFVHYLHWHYTRAFVEIFKLWTNLLWFVKEFFSFYILLKTFFMPWQRLRGESRGTIGEWLGSKIITLCMSVVGMIVRSIVIVFGAVVMLLVFLAGVLLMGVWPLLPILVLFYFVTGLVTVFKELIL